MLKKYVNIGLCQVTTEFSINRNIEFGQIIVHKQISVVLLLLFIFFSV